MSAINQQPLSEYILPFLESLEIEHGLASKTLQNYELYLGRLIDFASAEITPAQITDKLVRQYRLWLNRFVNHNGEELSLTTQTYHLIALRSWLHWFQDTNIKSLDPSRVRLPKITRKQVTFLYDQEIEEILDEIDDSKIAGQRDRAIIELLFSTGLRVSELAKLNRSDVNLEKREFLVRGKGGKDRPVFLTEEAANSLANYLENRDDNLPAMFLNYSRNQGQVDQSGDFRRLTPRAIQNLVSKYSKLAGITKKVTPHTLRHSFATDLLMNGADIRAVQNMLGHSSITTTQIYTHVTDSHLREVHRKFHSDNQK